MKTTTKYKSRDLWLENNRNGRINNVTKQIITRRRNKKKRMLNTKQKK
jgi:hypothetical protein